MAGRSCVVLLIGGVSMESPRGWRVALTRGSARIERHAFADFLTRGELDRHLRRMRARYRNRRDTLVDALTETLPEAAVRGVAAGLHITVQLPDGDNEEMIREEAHHRASSSKRWPTTAPKPEG